MKKKILFMVINMNIGGTEKALLNMLSEIDTEKYDVTVLMLEKSGGFFKDIPKWVNIQYLDYYNDIKDILNKPLHITALQQLKLGKVTNFVKYLYLYFLSKISKERTSLFKYILKNYPNIELEYDLAVAYAGPMEFISYFVANKINAKKKIQWIHFDITKIGFNCNFAIKLYNKFDKIFVVSNEAKDKLVKLIPSLNDKINVFYNIISSDMIQQMANKGESFYDNFNGIRILTVGRLSKEKGQDITIPVLSKLRKEGYNVRWYCIGEGNLRNECEKLIKKYNLENNYILLGSSSNPYAYMKDCDIYVQPSRYEGYCVTTVEAKCLNKLSIVTNVNGMGEQFKHMHNGLIAESSIDSLYESIKKILDNNKLKEIIEYNLSKEIINSDYEIEKLYSIMH